MELGVFADSQVALTLNEATVPIYVDATRFPHVEEIYGFGGFPSCIFLTPDGRTFGGGLLLPLDSFRVLLDRVIEGWQVTPAIISMQADQIDSLYRNGISNARFMRPNEQFLVEAENAIYNHYDSTYGGFGNQPKFPLPDVNYFMLTATAPNGSLLFKGEIEQTFVAQQKLLDPLWGGVARSALFADWSGIAGEKTLSGNAELAMNYLDLFTISKNGDYRNVVERIIKYLDERLKSGRGWGWFDSQAGFVVRDGQVLDLRDYQKLDQAAREQVGIPPVDSSMYLSANATAISAYLRAGRTLERRDLIDYALQTLDTINARAKAGDGAFRHDLLSNDSPAELLADHVALLSAAIDAYETAGRDSYLQLAESIAGFLRNRLLDNANGGLLVSPSQADGYGRTKYDFRPFEANTRAGIAVSRLLYLTNNQEYFNFLERIMFYVFSSRLTKNDLRLPNLATAYLHVTRYPIKLAVAGPGYDSLLATVWKDFHSRLVVRHLGDGSREVPYGLLRFAPTDRAQLFVCGEDTVSAPLYDPAGVDSAIVAFQRALAKMRPKK